ncbi:DNA alkylation repair protein [Albirhodobacter sp. R86504]|uniref:DNA alkylation repair protein n=1 Tax=Albirhodobacter sp. R86504 TaxID=3093848 RepID=UPI003671D897
MTRPPKAPKLPPEEEARLAAEAEAFAASEADYEFYDADAEASDPSALGALPTGAEAIEMLEASADPEKAVEAAAYHKAERRYLGVSVPLIDDLVTLWRAQAGDDAAARVALARDLWASDIHEAMVASAKLLTQARLRPDGEAWDLIASWVPLFDAWAIADAVCKAGDRRLVADPSRLDEVEAWIYDENMWARRATLVMTLPWTKQRNPSEADTQIRERVMNWMVILADDRSWFIQKAIATWLRELSKRDPERVQLWLNEHGRSIKKFARIEAGKLLPQPLEDELDDEMDGTEDQVEGDQIAPTQDASDTPKG